MLTSSRITSIIFSFFFSWVFLFPAGWAGFFGGIVLLLRGGKAEFICLYAVFLRAKSAPHYPAFASAGLQRRYKATCDLLMFYDAIAHRSRRARRVLQFISKVTAVQSARRETFKISRFERQKWSSGLRKKKIWIEKCADYLIFERLHNLDI